MRIYLKIKVVSLAAEAKLIRREEHRIKAKPRAAGEAPPAAWFGLNSHRREDVRNEARAACLAYGYLRGRAYKQMEAKCHTKPPFTRVVDLVKKYGTKEDYEKLAAWIDAA